MARDWWTNWDIAQADTVFGPLLGGHSVQEAFYNTMQKWLASYIAEFNRALGSNVLLEPFEYRHRPEYRTLPRSASAAVLVEVPHTVGKPEYYQEFIRANWMVDVLVYVYGTKDWQETQALTQAYAACVRSCIVQHKGLEGFAETTIWEGEEYMEGEHSSGRTTGVAHIAFTVTVGNAVKMYGGVPLPQFAPPGAVTYPTTLPPTDPTVTTTANVVVEKE